MIEAEIQEQLRNKYNPEGSDLRKIQLNMLDILIEFDRVCHKNGIVYWLDSGTLLGAVRHGGFIPWDDDIDVCIMKKDLRSLKKAMKKDLNPSYSFCMPSIRERQSMSWCRIINPNIRITRPVFNPKNPKELIPTQESLWLDIFLQINGNPSVSRFIDKLYGRCRRRFYRSITDGIFKRFASIVIYPFILLIVIIAEMLGKILSPGTLIHNFGSGFYSTRMVKEIFPLETVSFEGKKFPSPHDYDSYLSRIFGDYRQIPDTDKIKTHNVLKIEISENNL